ncbi:uncharacterized protein LOC142223038 [Haematobia irritans]|uniref:uncharacterized protein LOC142223038 n=1 Tax=Haematobia irritans TaxID=7368 RepID=UPI003F508CDD
MDQKKILLLFSIVAIMWTTGHCQAKTPGLRRKPKIYNALITTDENLVQSRAYPVIQPTIHESGIAHYHPFGPYGPYGSFYNPHLVRFGQPIAPNLTPKEQLPYPLPPGQFPPQLMGQPLGPQPQLYPGYPQAPPSAAEATTEEPPTMPTAAGAPEQPAPTVQPPTMLMPATGPPAPKDPNAEEKLPSEQLPIALNQYGLPPSLIPLRQPYPPAALASRQSPYLPPYAFNQFPPLYYKNPPALRQQFLPPYGYLPTGPQFPLSNAIPTDDSYPYPAQPATPAPTKAPKPTTTEAQPPTETQESQVPAEPQPSFENIKNGSKSEDSNVPDVPPPPIPSGAKSKKPQES